MASTPTSFTTNFGRLDAPAVFRLQFGRREIRISRDSRNRFYAVHPLLDCNAGVEAGYLEILLLRRWLVTLSKAR